MKRKVALTLALLLAAALAAGCAAGEDKPSAQLPNPVEEVDGPEDFLPLGIAIDAPQNAEDVSYAIISDTVAQVEFTLDGNGYTYRAAKGEGDISGVSGLFNVGTLNANWEFEGKGVSAVVKTAETGGRLATWEEAGISYSLWTESAVSDDVISSLVLKLVVQQGLADPEDTPAPFAPVDFLEARTAQADLNGDGALETVNLVTTTDEYGWEHNTLNVTTADGTVYELQVGEEAWLLEIQWVTVLQLIDLDPDDGMLEVVLSGDYASSDYITLICRFDGTQILIAGSEDLISGETYSGIYGEFEGAENGIVTISDAVDVLGTWWGTRRYALSTEGAFVFFPVEGELWQRADGAAEDPQTWADEEFGRALRTKAELPVTLDGEGETALPAGTKLLITASDNSSIARFVLEDGRTGTIAFVRDTTDWVTRINGIEESEYFEVLPYAG